MSAISPPVLGPNTGIRAAARRIGAMVLRYFYLLKSSWARVVELAYWPTMQMLIWGLTTEFLMSHSAYFVRAGGVLIAAVLLWDILFRGNLGVSLSFLEEMWSRNLGQLFASPLRPYEWAASLVLISFLRTLIGILPAALLAIPIYHFSIFSLGLPLVVFFGQLLVFGAAIGLTVSALVLRYGLGAESLAWVAVFAIAPLSGIYYPIATLPEWLQPVAWRCAGASLGPCLRGHARDPGRWCVRVRPDGVCGRPKRALPDHRAVDISACLRHCAPAWHAAADG